MSTRHGAALYSPELLALAVRLADYPLRKDLEFQGSARSRSCGTEIDLSLGCDNEGRITDLGIQAKACAVGQASAAIFADHAIGRNGAEIADSLAEIQQWLASSGGTPCWPGIEALEPALAYQGRHQAILLPWRAALEALCNPATTR